MELVPKAEFSIVTRANKAWIPELIAAASPEVTETYIAFFTATIRNRNTRQAYARACWQFDSSIRCRVALGGIVALATRRCVLLGSGETGLRN